MLPEQFILLDTEYTAWEGSRERGWSGENEYKEIIQIGAVKVSPRLIEADACRLYVRPQKNPVLSDYIIRLTGITQRDIDTAPALGDVLPVLARFCNDLPIYSWGQDGELIKENCELIGVYLPIASERFRDIRDQLRPVFMAKGIDISAYTSGTVIQAFGESGERAHDAVNDMRNLLQAIQILRSEQLL